MIAQLRGPKARAGCEPVKVLAKAAGVKGRTVENDEDDNGAPFRTTEEYLAWRAANRHQRSMPSVEGDGDENLQIQRLKAEIYKLKQDGRGKALKNDVSEGKLVPLDNMLSQVSELVLRVKHRLESIPDEIAPEFSPDVRGPLVEMLKDKIYLLLTEMSQWRLEGE